MREYRERLGVPASWWLLVTACVALLGTTLVAGLSLTLGIVIYAALECAAALVLGAWGWATVTVTAAELSAGSGRLPVGRIAEVAVMDRAQTRALLGPRADPAAYLLTRPYLPRAVYVGIAGRPPDQPYWLISTRRPAELAAAIQRARSGAPAGSVPAGHDAAHGGAGHREPGQWDDGDGAGLSRKDGNA
jgi:Protein of unknown function (DUF3093)